MLLFPEGTCTSFVFNFCNFCTGLYISNVHYHSSVTEQNKFCRHGLPFLHSWWICFSDRVCFFVYRNVALLQWINNFNTSRQCQIIIYQEQNTFFSSMQVIFSFIYNFFLPMSKLRFPKLWIKLTSFGHVF